MKNLFFIFLLSFNNLKHCLKQLPVDEIKKYRKDYGLKSAAAIQKDHQSGVRFIKNFHNVTVDSHDVDCHWGNMVGIKSKALLKIHKDFVWASANDWQNFQNNSSLSNYIKIQGAGIVINNHQYNFIDLTEKLYLTGPLPLNKNPLESLRWGGKLLSRWFYQDEIKRINDFYGKPENITTFGSCLGYTWDTNTVENYRLFYLVFQKKIYVFSRPNMIKFPIENINTVEQQIMEDVATINTGLDNTMAIPQGLQNAEAISIIVTLGIVFISLFFLIKYCDKSLKTSEKKLKTLEDNLTDPSIAPQDAISIPVEQSV